MTSAPRISISVETGLSHIPREAWNRVANPDEAPYDPFLDWDFLEALEATGCVSRAEGWSPLWTGWTGSIRNKKFPDRPDLLRIPGWKSETARCVQTGW